MAKTLLELFETKTLSSGKTAEKEYDIRDSKDIGPKIQKVANPLITYTGMVAKRGGIELTQNIPLLDTRTSETFLEQEGTGNRVVRLGSLPIIYGTELPRMLLKSTPTLDEMRDATSGPISETNGLGSKIRNGVDNAKSTLGLPTPTTPTYVVNQLNTIGDGISITQNRITDLSKIKTDAAGTALGQFLSDVGGGTPNQMAKGAVGGGIRFAKSSANNRIMGSSQRVGFGENRGQQNKIVLGEDSNTETSFTKESGQWYGVYNYNYGSVNINQKGDSVEPQIVSMGDNERRTFIDNEGLPYSKTILRGDDDNKFGINTLAQKQQLSSTELNAARLNDGVVPNAFLYSKTPKRFRKFDKDGDINFSDVIDIDDSELISNDIQNKYGFHSNRDELMLSEFDIDRGDDTTYDDFILLKFKSIEKDTTVQFRSTITGLNETFSPSWDSAQFLGSPFDYHTYTKISRAVSFSFTVYSMSVIEHKNMWKRLNFLTSLVYPQGYYESSAIKPPLLEFTLGSMYENKPSFITQLSYTVDDNAEWEIGNYVNERGVAKKLPNLFNPNASTVSYIDVDKYKLPRSIQVQIGLTILESRGITENRQFYSFNPITN